MTIGCGSGKTGRWGLSDHERAGWEAYCSTQRYRERLNNLRKYGKPPFKVAVVHGGPGAGEETAPVARELSLAWGVWEPIQTATSLEGQRAAMERSGKPP